MSALRGRIRPGSQHRCSRTERGRRCRRRSRSCERSTSSFSSLSAAGRSCSLAGLGRATIETRSRLVAAACRSCVPARVRGAHGDPAPGSGCGRLRPPRGAPLGRRLRRCSARGSAPSGSCRQGSRWRVRCCSPRSRRVPALTPAALVPAALSLLTPSLSGHASVSGKIALVADIAHVTAAAVWVGGLAALVLALVWAGTERWELAASAVPRFSGIAVVAVSWLIASGTISGYLQVRALPRALGDHVRPAAARQARSRPAAARARLLQQPPGGATAARPARLRGGADTLPPHRRRQSLP